jgi:hypothetical protein
MLDVCLLPLAALRTYYVHCVRLLWLQPPILGVIKEGRGPLVIRGDNPSPSESNESEPGPLARRAGRQTKHERNMRG